LDIQQCHGIQAILNQIQVQIQNSSNLNSELPRKKMKISN